LILVTKLVSDADDTFFERIMINSEHVHDVLQQFLPEKPDMLYNLRERTHSLSHKTLVTLL